MKQYTYTYDINKDFPNIIGETQLPLFSYENAREVSYGDKSMLSLFSGCGGMDLGFEGGFICHKASVGQPGWVRTCCCNPTTSRLSS